MSVEIEVPEHLLDDMVVLFINPYSPEDSEELNYMGATDEKLIDSFKRTNAADPGFQKWEDTVATVMTMHGLAGYSVGDDLIILYGDKEQLDSAKSSLEALYTCFFDTIGHFKEYLKRDDAAVTIPEEKPKLQ